jgi:bifunctional non-homologous end joining protein LigD
MNSSSIVDERERSARTKPARRTSAAPRDRIPIRVSPMLATLVPEPFHAPGWVYEEKYDGYRVLAYKEGSRVTLVSRNGLDRTDTFADVAAAVAALPDRTLLLDGEVVAFDRARVSRFQLLQRGSAAPTYACFDCLYRNGSDLRKRPLSERRAELEQALARRSARLFVSRRLAANGRAAYRTAKRRGFEGLVAKAEASPYEERRSRYWLKVKVHQEEEFVIGGFTPPRGGRRHIGALLLGAYAGKDLRFVGKVGTGFSEKTLASLAKQLGQFRRSTPPFVDPPREPGATWLEPRAVAQIAFQEWTADGKLRQPVFLVLRDDKRASEVRLPKDFSP